MKTVGMLMLFAVFTAALSVRQNADACFTVFIDPETYNCYCVYIAGSGWSVCTQQGSTCYLSGYPCGGSGCFPAGTPVETRNGLRAIESLDIGDEVLSLDDDGAMRYCPISRTHKTVECGYYLINSTIRVTGSHPFRIGDEWVKVQDLTVGAVLLGRNLEPVVVESIALVDVPVRVYNIEVSGAHTFFAGGVLVHNKGPEDPFQP